MTLPNNTTQLIPLLSQKIDHICADTGLIAKEIVSHVISNDKNIYNKILSDQQIEKINKIIEKINKNIPLAYILKKAQFFSLDLHINNSVLIPRVETEQLVQIAIDYIKRFKNKPAYILDLGTGSGNIIISLAKFLPFDNFKFIATDISNKALKLASENAKRNDVDITFIKSNFLQDIDPELISKIKKSVHFIISNPPYIPPKVYNSLSKSVKAHEPRKALHGGKRGVKYYNRIKKQISNLQLSPQGIFLEIDPLIRRKVVKIFKTGTVVSDSFSRKRFFIKLKKLPAHSL